MSEETDGIVIGKDKIFKALSDNMESILKDVLTGWNSPVQEVFKSDEFKNAVKDMFTKMYKEILADQSFQNKLKDELFNSMISKIISSTNTKY